MKIQSAKSMGSLLMSAMLVACGPSFKTTDQAQTAPCTTDCQNNNGSSGVDDPTTPPSQNNDAWNNLQVDGQINGGRFDKTQVVSIDKTNKELVVRLPMLANPFLDGALIEIPIRDIPGARLGLESLSDGGSALALRIPLEHVLRGIRTLPPSRLPNGDRLPAIPEGELPSTAVSLAQSRNIKATIYLAPTVVGLYVNTPFDPYIRLTLPIRNQARTQTLGYFSTIPAKSGVADGGFFLSVALPADLARTIDDSI